MSKSPVGVTVPPRKPQGKSSPPGCCTGISDPLHGEGTRAGGSFMGICMEQGGLHREIP